MHNRLITLRVTLLTALIAVGSASGGPAKRSAKVQPGTESIEEGKKVLWETPVDISTRNLISGEGGRGHAPASTGYRFEKEDLSGSNPKFTVRDRSGEKWKIKLGDEARPETVAARLIWAVGFHTDEDYFLPAVHVSGVPANLHRGQKFIDPDGTMHNARLKREPSDLKKVGSWKWSDDAFTGSREWNGLRVMMALTNNWDVKDENNSIYEVRHRNSRTLLYVVSDLGASFGPTHLDLGRKKDKGELDKFEETTFVHRVHGNEVDFNVPGAPSPIMIFDVPSYFRHLRLMWIGRNIPREDARWMGSILSRLSAAQIRDAFRAGGYSPDEVRAFAGIVQRRIGNLSEL